MSADIAIIGAGIVGIMAAWQAHKRDPSLKILNIEQSLLGSGASRYCGAFAPMYGENEAVLTMARQSRDAYLELKQAIPTLPFYDMSSYWIIEKDHLADLGKHLHPPCTRPAEAADWDHRSLQASGFVPTDEHAMLVHSVGSYALPSVFMLEMAAAVKRNPNYTLLQSLKVDHLDHQNGEYILKTSDGSEHRAKKVIVAVGPWFPSEHWLSPSHQLDVKIKKVVAFHIHQRPHAQDRALFFEDHEAFLLPVKELGYWVFSYRCDQWDVMPDFNQLTINPDNVSKAKAILEQIAPAFVKHCQGGTAFCDAYGGGNRPIVEKGLLGENLAMVTGTAGAGFRLAPSLAIEALDMLQVR